ncbi:hypothetical protein PGTUg99_001965 [Puccinia graminis f. sp. tritici]|uniref:Uncharacterized protein n=1 Tax=Puccinia graminis f. sp. tritici TaxID=56615 RepID=A0A5B0RWE5_PUCGR|nr:hypothetical protein PGTUg99_001965 [Puccinia graminis f. sp. tritici]
MISHEDPRLDSSPVRCWKVSRHGSFEARVISREAFRPGQTLAQQTSRSDCKYVGGTHVEGLCFMGRARERMI